jgi:mannose-6-phosphate isomerase-like protein (cupin superfamily)
MCVPPHQELGLEVHTENDQFFRFEQGTGICTINGNEYALSDGIAIIVPKGAEHNIVNTSATEDLKFYTIYSPHHKDGTIHATKADEVEEDFDGITTE